MSDFLDRLLKAAGAASVGGSVGASIGGSVVSAVSGIGGSVFGPAGTFFGADYCKTNEHYRVACLL